MNPQTLTRLFAQLIGSNANAGEQALGTATVNAVPETGDAAIATNLFNNAVDMQIPMSEATADKFNNLFGDGTGFSNARYDAGEILNPNVEDFDSALDPFVSPSEFTHLPNTDPSEILVTPAEDAAVLNFFPHGTLIPSWRDDAARPHKNTALGRWFNDKWSG